MKKQESDQGIQINKYISNSGFCSRREADKLVDDARVTINDDIALPTSRVQAGDVVALAVLCPRSPRHDVRAKRSRRFPCAH